MEAARGIDLDPCPCSDGGKYYRTLLEADRPVAESGAGARWRLTCEAMAKALRRWRQARSTTDPSRGVLLAGSGTSLSDVALVTHEVVRRGVSERLGGGWVRAERML